MKKISIFILQFVLLMALGTKSVFAGIKINSPDINLGVNNHVTLKVAGNSSNNYSWESDNTAVATVNASGVVTGVGTGTANIKVIEGSNVDFCKVTVINNYVPVTSITLTTSSATILVNDVKKIEASIFPINSSNKTITYISQDNSIATVDSEGYVTGKSLGTTYISVNIEDKTAIYKVTVSSSIPLVSISTIQSLSLKVNETKKVTVTYNPTNATNKKVTWKSSNSNIATVDQNGNIRGVAAGSTNVTVTSNDGNHTSTIKVTVTANQTNPTNPTNPTNSTNPTNPTNSTTTTTTTKSSSTSSTDPGSGKALRNIYLNKNRLSLSVGDTQTLTVTFSPSDATNKKVTWTSSDSKIVTVDSEGKIKAIAAGTASVTVTSDDGGITDTCKITVTSSSGGNTEPDDNDTSLKSISFERKNIVLKEGKETKLNVIFNPENATNQNVTWSIDNEEVATVNNGIIKALKQGTTKVKAKSVDGGYEATCNISVYSNEPVESIEFEKKRQTMYVDSTLTLKLISTPENTMIDNPIWTSSNEEVATVIDGEVKSLKVGTTTITVSDEAGSITASTTVNVIKKLPDKLVITVEGYNINFDENVKSYTIKIGSESQLKIKTNYDDSRVTISGNRDLKNGSIVKVTVTGDTKRTYIFNIKKSEFSIIYIIGIGSVFLLLNIVRIIIKGKKKKKK